MIIQPDKHTEDLINVKTFSVNSLEDISVEFIIENITEQIRNLGNMTNLPDYMLLFFNRFLEIESDDVSTIMDSSIYLDLSEEQQEIVDTFMKELNNVFFTHFGIYYSEYTLRSLYHLYQVMVLNFNQYSYHYMQGLSKDYNEYIDNPKEFNVTEIEKKEMFSRIRDGYDRRKEAINYTISYITETSIYLEHFFEIISYSSEGDDSIEFLLNEYENYRLTYFDSFLLTKLVQIMSSEIYIESVTNEYMNSLKNLPII